MSDDDTSLKYPRLNLSIDSHSKALSEDTLFRTPRDVDQFWYDATVVIVRFFQLTGITWLLGLYYGWPSGWLQAISWTSLFNLDLFSFFEYHDIGYFSQTIHNILVIFAPLIIAAGYYGIFKLLARDPKSGLLLKPPRKFLSLVAMTNDIMYIPVALAFWRCLACGPDRGIVLFSSGARCSEAGYFAQLAIAIIVGLPFLIALPIWYSRWVSKYLLFDNDFDHRFYVQTRELEYLLGLGDMYARHHVFLFAGQSRTFAYSRLWQHAIYFVMCAPLVLLGPAVTISKSAILVNSILVLAAMLIPLAIRVRAPQYRVSALNVASVCCELALFVMNTISVITAGSPGSDLVQGDRITPALVTFHLLAVASLVYVLWTATRASRWSVSEQDVLDVCVGNSALLFALNSAQTLLEEALFTPAEFFPKHKIGDLVVMLRQYHAQFFKQVQLMRRGTYTKPLVRFPRSQLAMDPRVAHQLNLKRFDVGVWLMYAAEDTVDDLVRLYGAMRHTLSAFSGGDAKGSHGEHVRECLRGFGQALKRKNAERVLLRPEKHMLVRKLVMVRALLGDDFLQHANNPTRMLNVADVHREVAARHALRSHVAAAAAEMQVGAGIDSESASVSVSGLAVGKDTSSRSHNSMQGLGLGANQEGVVWADQDQFDEEDEEPEPESAALMAGAWNGASVQGEAEPSVGGEADGGDGIAMTRLDRPWEQEHSTARDPFASDAVPAHPMFAMASDDEEEDQEDTPMVTARPADPLSDEEEEEDPEEEESEEQEDYEE